MTDEATSDKSGRGEEVHINMFPTTQSPYLNFVPKFVCMTHTRIGGGGAHKYVSHYSINILKSLDCYAIM